MEDKQIDFSDAFISLKRIELLLEEIVFQQCIIRSNEDEDLANQKFKNALKNVDEQMKQHLSELPDAE